MIIYTYDQQGNEVAIGKSDRLDHFLGLERENLYITGITAEAIHGENDDDDDFFGIESEPQHLTKVRISRLDREALRAGDGRARDPQLQATVGPSGFPAKERKFLPPIVVPAQVNERKSLSDAFGYAGDDAESMGFLVVPNARATQEGNNHWRLTYGTRRRSA